MRKKNSLLWIFKRINKRIPALVIMTLAHVGHAFMGVVFALGTRAVIDCAVAGQKDAFVNACVRQGMIIGILLLCLTIYRHKKEHLSALLDRDWKKNLLDGLLHGEYCEVSGYHSGELINRMNNDVRMVNEGVLNVFPNLAAMLTRLAAAMTVLLVLEPWFAIVILIMGILVVVTTAFMRKNLKGLHKKVSEQEGIVSGFLQEVLEKLLIVQAMDIADEMEKRSDKFLEQRFQIQRKRKNVSLVANTSVSILAYGAGFVTLVWCAFQLLNGRITFGSMTAVIQLVNQLQTPFVSISGVIPQYISMIASAERLMELEQIPREKEVTDESTEEIYKNMQKIVAKDICFSYEREEILKDASFELPKGAFAVITGPSGIGKSTLLKVFLGIFGLDGGEIYIEGNRKMSVDRSTRKLFAYVPQGNLLFSGTLRDNLIVAKPDATEEEIRKALFVSAMDEYLEQMPEGLDTIVGENAAGLSEGQAQRLAIARAILGGAPILLLDECTSALDELTEKKVLERIRGLDDRTCIAVTHRPAALEICDYNMVIGEKKIKKETM